MSNDSTSISARTAATISAEQVASRERADLLETLRTHREFLCFTTQGLTDEQARRRPTASELSIGGLVKHVADTERDWARFMTGAELPSGDVDWENPDPDTIAAYAETFMLRDDETLAGVLADYAQVAAATDELVMTLPDLDAEYPLPSAPWFPTGARRSVRRVITHIIAETAQHAGHADILRESLDGQRTMG